MVLARPERRGASRALVEVQVQWYSLGGGVRTYELVRGAGGWSVRGTVGPELVR